MIDGIKLYYRVAGFRGLAAISMYRVCRLPNQITVKPKNARHQITLRMKTSDVSLYRNILINGEYDFDLPYSPRTIIDAGANIGNASIFYANKYPDAQIIAIEPETSNYQSLCKNVSPYPNIKTIHAGLWGKDGELDIFNTEDKSACYAREGHTCRAISMPTLMAEFNIEEVDLLKVDIEGAEVEVFSNATWMDRVGMVVVELHDRFRPGCGEAVESVTRGFQRSEHGEYSFFRRDGARGKRGGTAPAGANSVLTSTKSKS